MKRTVEFRAYNLRPGTRAEFHRLVIEASYPLLQKWKVDVVDFGPSLHDENTYYLIRAYDSLDHRQHSQDAFYGSPEWRRGPREAIIALIESDTSLVIELQDEVVGRLRRVVKSE